MTELTTYCRLRNGHRVVTKHSTITGALNQAAYDHHFKTAMYLNIKYSTVTCEGAALMRLVTWKANQLFGQRP